IAAIFHRHNLDRHSSAGYYFHVEPKKVGIASGAYMPGPVELYAIRTWLTENYDDFLKVTKPAEKLMGKLTGSSLSRTPKGFPAEHPAADLVKMKQWFYWQELDVEIATSGKIFKEVIKRFESMAPFVDAINAVVRRASPKSRPAARGFD